MKQRLSFAVAWLRVRSKFLTKLLQRSIQAFERSITHRVCLFVQRGGLVRCFWGSNGSMISHSLSVKLLEEYGIGSKTAFLFDLSLSAKIPNGFYKHKKAS
jgi:hypothetical protein